MFFEDEKDIIESGADIHISEDGTVTWEDVLSDTEKDLVSVKDSIPNNNNKEKQESVIDLGDELELVSDIDEDVNEEELKQILSEQESPKQKAFDAFGNAEKQPEEISNEDEFDIDSQLASVASEENDKDITEKEVVLPKKDSQKKSSGLTMVLLAVLFAVVVVAGVYQIIGYTKDNNLNQEELMPNKTVQEEMNNITQEELSQRVEENIPVVNENEVGEIKPDEQPVQEKKEVIDIKSTGRANPFMPLQKYIAVEIPETVIDYDKSGLPKPPETYGVQDERTTKMLTIAVSGIMYDETSPSAIITFDGNDYFVQKGDKLDDYRVIDISRSAVTIALGKNLYKAKVGEEFKITSNFYGSAQYLSPKQGGGRQYYSVSDEKDTKPERGVAPASRYVSEEDVIINSK